MSLLANVSFPLSSLPQALAFLIRIFPKKIILSFQDTLQGLLQSLAWHSNQVEQSVARPQRSPETTGPGDISHRSIYIHDSLASEGLTDNIGPSVLVMQLLLV